MSQPKFDVKNRIQKITPAERLISQDLKDKAIEAEDVQIKEQGVKEPEKEKISSINKNEVTEKKEEPIKKMKSNVIKQKRKDGKVDRRFKDEEEKYNRKFPLSLKDKTFCDLELIAFYRKTSVNLLINDLIEKNIDQKELKRYKEIEETLNR